MRLYTLRKKQKRGHTIKGGSNKGFVFGFYGLDGYKTPTEDRISKPIITDSFSIFAVFDGHGGAKVSDYVSKLLPLHIKAKIAGLDKPGTIASVLISEFENIDNELIHVGLGHEGSTGTVCVVTRDYIIAANIGDSPAFVFSKDFKLLQCTEDHDCENVAEVKRVSALGETVENSDGLRLSSGLAVTRAFGDIGYGKENMVVIATPQIYIWPRVKGSYLAICSDSFKEGFKNGQIDKTQDCKDIVNEIKPFFASGDILEKVAVAAVTARVNKLGGNGDNTSLLLVEM
jgi:serine/threonine protein phosphatase PrpC